MTVIPVDRVLDSLLDSLGTCPKSQEHVAKSLIQSISRIASKYVKEYESVISQKLPALQVPEWCPFVSHFEAIDTSVLVPVTIDEILESSIPRLFSTDVHVRKAALIPIRSVAAYHPARTLNRLISATKIFQINIEFFQVLQFLIPLTVDDQLKVISLVKFLFVECIEVVMLPALLTQVCNCVVLLCCYVGRRPDQITTDDDPIALMRTPPTTNPETLTILSDLWELISPLCWSKELMNRGDETEYEVVRATCALVAVMGSLVPLTGVFKNFIRSLQSAVIRLTINAKSPIQIVSSIESVRILTISGHVLKDTETTNALMPVFIDLGISIGLARSLTLLMHDMSDRGIGFLIDRISHSSQLSSNDQAITLHFLSDTLALRSDEPFTLLDSLVSTLDSFCASAEKTAADESHHLFALLNLIESSSHLAGFLLTVPMIDLVIQSSLISDSDIHTHRRNGGHKLSSVTAKIFGSNDKIPRNTLKAVRAKAWQVMHVLTQSTDEHNKSILAERVLETVHSHLPCGESLRVLLLALVDVRNHTIPLLADDRSDEFFVWTLINMVDVDSKLAAHAIGVTHPSLDGLDSVSMETCLSLISTTSGQCEKFIQKICSTLLSKRIFQRLIATREDPIAPLVSLFPACIPFCDNAGDLVSKFFINCEQEIFQAATAGNAMRTVQQFGSLLGSFARHQFPEFLHLVTDLVRKESRGSNFFAKFLSASSTHSSELYFGISRIALGVSCETSLNLVGDIIPVVRGIYLEPCMETLKAVESGSPNAVTGEKYEINSVPILATLMALEHVFNSFYSLSCETLNSICSGDSHSSSVFFNEIFSVLLPLILFKGQIETNGKSKSIPNVSFLAIRALTSIARIQKLNSKNFDRAIQFSVSLLVHGISTFSTVDISEYTDRIDSVSDLLVAVLSQMDKSQFLGLSRLAQSIQLAGSNGPLPILRKITAQVFANICMRLQFEPITTDEQTVHWLESLFACIPRQRDPITDTIVSKVVEKLMIAKSSVKGHPDLRTIFKDESVLPSSHLPAFVQLSLHASTDAYHDSAVYVLELLNDVLRSRGHCISPSESSRLTSLMFSHSENYETIQPKIIDCIHTLSSIHLTSTLTEMVNSVAAHPALTESQQNVIQSICRDKKMLVGLLVYTADVMNNSEPVDGELSQESHAAATILSEALSVVDSKVAQIVGKNCAQLFGTILMYESFDVDLVENFFSQIAPNLQISLDSSSTRYDQVSNLVQEFVRAKPSAAESLVEFFVTFMSRNPIHEVFDSQKITGLVAIKVVVSEDQQTLTPEVWGSVREKVVAVLRKTQNPLMVVNGLRILKRLVSTPLFTTSEVKLVIEILNSATNVDFLDLGIEILELSCRKKNLENKEWVKTFLSTIGLVTDILADRISSLDTETNVRVFTNCMQVVQNFCDLAIRSHAKNSNFESVLRERLVVELVVRRKFLSQLMLGDKDLCDKTIDSIERLLKYPTSITPDLCTRVVLKYLSVTPAMHSLTSPSRSPLVMEGALVAALGVAKSHPTFKPILFQRIKKFVKVYNRRDPLVQEARRRVLAHIGDIDWIQ